MPASTVCLGFDFDALSVWLAYDRVTPAMLNRGEYGARVGVPRILELLRRNEVPAATAATPARASSAWPTSRRGSTARRSRSGGSRSARRSGR